MISYSQLVVFGNDSFGQLGLGQENNNQPIHNPKICKYSLVITSISCGGAHSAFITDQGFLYTFGNNEFGQLGTGTSISSGQPMLVEQFQKVNAKCTKVSCGTNHTLAIVDNAKLFSWGQNTSGQLGLSTYNSQYLPQRVKSKYDVIKISAGDRHSGYIDKSNDCYLFGSNERGQLGFWPNWSDVQVASPTLLELHKIKSISCGITHTLFLSVQNQVYECGKQMTFKVFSKQDCQLREINEINGQNIVKISAKKYSAAISQKGKLYIWGDVSEEVKIKQSKHCLIDVSLGYQFGAALDVNGTIHTWGDNTFGQLGVGHNMPSNQFQPVQIQVDHIKKLACGTNFILGLHQVVNKKQNHKSSSSVKKIKENIKSEPDIQQSPIRQQYEQKHQLSPNNINTPIDYRINQYKDIIYNITKENDALNQQMLILHHEGKRKDKEILILINENQILKQKLHDFDQYQNKSIQNDPLVHHLQRENEIIIKDNIFLQHEINRLQQQVYGQRGVSDLLQQIDYLKIELLEKEQRNIELTQIINEKNQRFS